MSISKEAKTVCVLSGIGPVSNVTLHQSNLFGKLWLIRWSSGGREEGFENEEIGYVQVPRHFEILSLSAFFIRKENGETSIGGGMSVWLEGLDERVIGVTLHTVCRGNGRKLALWNLAIHQYKEFTLPPSRDYNFCYSMGLGYDAANDNYKIVVLSDDLRSASVYETRPDSWIDIIVPHNMLSKNALEKWTPTTIVKDCPYWTCSRLSSDEMFLLSLGVVKHLIAR
nr:PREDICTED: uncharacterized protein LOC108204166 [Daucus carota subsp. sativus]